MATQSYKIIGVMVLVMLTIGCLINYESNLSSKPTKFKDKLKKMESAFAVDMNDLTYAVEIIPKTNSDLLNNLIENETRSRPVLPSNKDPHENRERSKNAITQISEKTNDSKRKNLLIVGETRSGTSFIFEAFSQEKNVFSFYEPFWGIRDFNNTSLSYKLAIVKAFLNCDFKSEEIHQYLKLISLPKKKNFFIREAKEKFAPTVIDNSAFSPVLMEKECKRRNNTVLKIITGRLQDHLHSLLSIVKDTTESVTRILHIVRDPRPVINSRRKLGWLPEFPSEKFEHMLSRRCNITLEVVKTCKIYAQEMEKKIMCTQYKDIAQNPDEHFKKFFSFSKVEYDKEMFAKWLKEHTQSKSSFTGGLKYAYDVKRNSHENIQRWMLESSVAQTRLIERLCQPLLKELELENSVI